MNGDHMLIAPPYTVTEEELVFLVQTLAKAVDVGIAAFVP